MKPISERKRQKFTGRRKSHTFLAMPHYLLNSDEFGALSSHATKLLMEVARDFNGKNNGNLSAAWSNLRRRGWRSKATVSAAIHELIEAKFLILTRQGGRHHICNLYAITWQPIDDCGGKHHAAPETVASNAWRKTEKEVAMRTYQVAMRTPDPEKAAA